MSLASPATPGPAVPPVDPVAHRRLVQALLRAGEPGGGGQSYALLWQCAAAEQERVGREPNDAECALELLVTEILALSHTAPWFGVQDRLTAAATEETIAFWTGTTQVSSRDAHLIWYQCWESRALIVQSTPTAAPPDVATAVAAEARLRREWAAAWRAWSQRADRSGWPPVPPAVPLLD